MPDFSCYGYHITRILGSSPEGGRATYLAQRQQDQRLVVLKVFYFGLASSSWSGYKAYEREIEVLRQLDHPRIPTYLDSFEVETGFCLVQEYKNAPSLATRRPFSLEQIKQIAISVLEVLVYLQSQRPPIFHRDLKPENILLDQQLNAYLIDFGLARIHGGSIALTSMAAGTLGFMPPEELYNRSLTRSSDLYSLGATLLCLATQTPSTRIGILVDQAFQLKVAGQIPGASRGLIKWLQRMVVSNPDDRFANAHLALEALRPLTVRGSNVTAPTPRLLLRSLGGVALCALPILIWANASPLPPSSNSRAQLNSLLSLGLCNEDPAEICDLRGITLRNHDLQGVNLDGALLTDITLSYSQLQGSTLRQATLDNARLFNTDLSHADLTQAFLERASLKEAKLYRADLSWARAQLADLSQANLRRARLQGINLTGAILHKANLTEVDLRLASLHHTILASADLSHADLSHANLPFSDLRGANLLQVNLQGASLLNSDLREANLVQAQLNSADLEGAILRGADLRGADLRGANLQQADLKDAEMAGAMLKGAILPDGSIQP